MKKLHILIPRHYDFNSSHHSSIWLESILPKLSAYFSIQITWFYYSPTKIIELPKKNNEDIVQIQDFDNAVQVIKKIKPDLILDSEFPTFIDLAFLAASKNYTFYVRKYSSHRVFKVPFKLRSTISHLNEDIPAKDKNEKQSTKRGNFFLYKYRFLIKSLIASKLTFFQKLNFFLISFKWNFITERPALNSKLQADLELLNSNSLKEMLIKKGYSSSKLSVIGNPMFDSVFRRKNNSQQNSGKKIKILLAPFQYYGAANEGSQNKIIQEIVETLQKKDQFSLVVKLHPSIPYLEYFNHMIHSIDDSIEIFQKGSIEKYIDEADLLITNGIFSSSAIYALALHKPVIFCNFYNLYSYDEYTNIIFECRNSIELVNVINTAYSTNNKKFQNIEKFLEQHYFKTDGRSSERVVNAIKQLVENKNTN